MESGNKGKRRLRLRTPTEIKRALNRIANMLINNEIDPKSANAISYICNVILGTFKDFGSAEEGDQKMKSNRQFTIQQLLRAAEITGDSERREQYLDEADKLIRKELSSKAIGSAIKAGVFAEE